MLKNWDLNIKIYQWKLSFFLLILNSCYLKLKFLWIKRIIVYFFIDNFVFQIMMNKGVKIYISLKMTFIII